MEYIKLALHKTWRATLVLVRIIVLVLCIFTGIFASLYIGDYLRLQTNKPCYVPGFITVSCTRLEGENDYLYVIVVERGTDQAIINYKVSKLRKIYL